MSTIKSSAENLTLNADGANNDVIIQSNGSTIVTVDGSQSSVGIGTATPTANSKVHIYNGASGQASSSNNTEVVVENNSNTGIHFLTPNTAVSGLWFGDPEDNDVGRMYYAHSDNSLNVFTGDTQRLKIDSDGLKFNADTAAANALDDYEEGTFEFSSSTKAGGSGTLTLKSDPNLMSYTKIGNRVFISGRVDVASNSGTGGRFELNGLPFTSANPGERAGDSILHVQIISGTGSQASGFLARVNAADNRLFVFTYTGVGTTNDSAPTLVADTLIYITGSYPV